ncbi:MAG: aminoacyl-tRNA hydrolase [Clostridiales Family XIII bacterium]|jgi:PTH1 family peptidyl-tRNA hydrolase|nr:aminoacyl-tRNA hydrolase [Clostridiales Family XIII bacterium]
MDYIIVGLGNPGRRYENTKHNMGFLALDLIAERNGIKINKIKHKALCGEGAVAGRRVLLVKPQTYMNLSGESVRAVMDYYKTPPSGLLVICDDVDIPIGRIRIREKGSAGSHNGMRSVIGSLGCTDFPRIRIGISDGQRERGDALVGYVLGGFRKQRVKEIEDAIERAADAAECLLSDGAKTAMNRYNARSPEKDEGPGGDAEAHEKKGGADEEQ